MQWLQLDLSSEGAEEASLRLRKDLHALTYFYDKIRLIEEGVEDLKWGFCLLG